jgi:hypothetical protein
MRGVYTGEAKISALAASKTLMLITAPSLKAVEILSAHIGNVGSNVTNQQLEACFQRVTTVGSAAGGAMTPSQMEVGDQASGSTLLSALTTEPTTYTANTQVGYQGFPSLGGYQFAPVPEERPVIPPAGIIGLRMLSTPTAIDLIVTVTYREIG